METMQQLDERELEFILKYRSLDNEGREKICEAIEELAKTEAQKHD